MSNINSINLEDLLSKELKDPAFKLEFDSLEEEFAYTGSFRTPILEIKGQLFRSKKDTCSGNKRTLSACTPE